MIPMQWLHFQAWLTRNFLPEPFVARRKDLHRRAAEAIEKLWEPKLDEQAAALGQILPKRGCRQGLSNTSRAQEIVRLPVMLMKRR